MIRSPLKSGEMIRLGRRDYTIKSILGDGATCIVYSADYKDSTGNSHDVNIKECYPYNADIVRNGQILVWASKEEQSVRLSAFGTAYEKLMSTQNGNFSVHAFDICEANGTQYIIMDRNDGKTFDKTPSAPLTDVLKTIRLLTYVVGSYHDRGYLHLDIKPSNFLVYSRPSEHIVLFDMDTVTPIEEIRKGNFNVTSYSDRWAAPEQKRCQLAKLCPATDIFAIGATLFEKIMGRAVTAADMGVFSNWDFDDDLFKDVNPKIKRLLRNIFKKTLSANIKRRYQETSELLADLDEAIEAAESKVYLLSNCPALTAQFIGREFEIRKIRQSFESKKRAIFLSGEGGIGKSLLAQAYAKQYREEYDAVLFYRYKDSLESLVDAIEIQNFDSNEGSKQTSLRRLLNERVLLIVDNFDVETTEERFLNEFLRYEAHILFTTRTDFSILNGGEVKQFIVTQLPDLELRQLFSRASEHTVTEEETPLLQKLLKSVDFNTYATELLGAQMRASDYSLEGLVNMVSPGLDALASSEKVLVNKDGLPSKDRIPKIIRELFRVAALSEERKQVLRNMYLLRFLNIDRATYTEFSRGGVAESDTLNELLELSWVRKSGTYFTLHPLVEEIVRNDLTPSEENCSGVYNTISTYIHRCQDFDDHSGATAYTYEKISSLICSFFDATALARERDRELLYEFLLVSIANRNIQIGSPTSSCFLNIYSWLKARVNSSGVLPVERMKIRYVLLAVAIRSLDTLFFEDRSAFLTLKKQRVTDLETAFSLAIKEAGALSPSAHTLAMNGICSLLFYHAKYICTFGFSKNIICQLYNEYPQESYFSINDKKYIGIPLTLEEQKVEDARLERIRKNEKSVATAPLGINPLVEEFDKSEKKLSFIEEIVGNSTAPTMSRVRSIGACMYMLFPIHWKNVETELYINNTNWEEIEKMLDIEETFLVSKTCVFEATRDDDEDARQRFLNYNNIHHIFLCVVRGDIESYELRMTALMDTLARDIVYRLDLNCKLEFLADPSYFDIASINSVVLGLKRLGKTSWVLPYLIRFAEGWECYLQKKDILDKNILFPAYQTIISCAVASEAEKTVPPQYQRDFKEIQSTYQQKVDRITDTRFHLRSKED